MSRKAPSPLATRYRGDVGTLMWVLHRVTGTLILLFLFAHVVDIASVRWGPEVFNRVVGVYKVWFNRVLVEPALVAAVLFHAFNGIRVILIDLTAWGARRQRELAWAVFGVTVALFVPAAYFMIRPVVFG